MCIFKKIGRNINLLNVGLSYVVRRKHDELDHQNFKFCQKSVKVQQNKQ